ncbi:MAG: TIGR04282 family arsenosugar biosynthesis glycosyltransferase [Chthoniobacterales bacterium]
MTIPRLLSPLQNEASAQGRCAFAIMTKAPRAGHVKTRLTPPLSAEESAALNRAFLRDLSAAITASGEPGQGIACFTPAGSREVYYDLLPAGFLMIPQREGDLSARLIGAVDDLFSIGFRAVCLLNSDSPTVLASSFADAARFLSGPDDCLVLGPSDDGGYYLIGMNQPHPQLFEGIDWSTDRVLSQTRARADAFGVRVQVLPSCFDVDDKDTLHRLCEDLFGPNETEGRPRAPSTRQFLAQIINREGRTRIWPHDSAETGA